MIDARKADERLQSDLFSSKFSMCILTNLNVEWMDGCMD